MSDLKFGTSGLRGLVEELDDEICQRYTIAFLRFLRKCDCSNKDGTLLVGRDLRQSSQRIANAVMAAAIAEGYKVKNYGRLPTPALALSALYEQSPAIMVTGSHIPEDRNGLKFYRPDGEITKVDEQGILNCLPLHAPYDDFEILPYSSLTALDRYRQRAFSVLPFASLSSMRIGVYQHSSVARDIMVDIIAELGAEVIPLHRAEYFIPVDTEALRQEDRDIAKKAAKEYDLDALISTDGDGDRPLLADGDGNFLRGDILGMLTAKFLNADAVVTPVTSTSLVETSNWFSHVYRSKVGSPYVIADMNEAEQDGSSMIVGFEANGGVLLGSDAALENGVLPALPTRDALLPILCVLGLAQMNNLPINALCEELPLRFTSSSRVQGVPSEKTEKFLVLLSNGIERIRFFKPFGTVKSWDAIDGLRVILQNGEIIHFRASGNAPELRCYSEAASQQRADQLVAEGLECALAELS
ncbi:phosphomannomutase [Bartonella sp. HY329]|uniref:phosphomannomutase n=1 Tax=unclassified Bartonella TaxID=2645622 RepID=UPI0021C5AEAA|nr:MULTISPECIES: phosphomannomutase [unclassified Bartonella]UXM95131.1 phosphomannomutase [Bartonella sp. HY329]UXN09454.1 phosphomannomutase [Bartonella sp. HY328]